MVVLRKLNELKDAEIYVAVTEYDPVDERPIVFEQYTDCASLDEIKDKIARLGSKYGKARIAALYFID